MSVYLYRLYAVQSFKGEKVGVYIHEGNYPDPQILSDAQDIVDGTRTRGEVLESTHWFYDVKYTYPDNGSLNRERLTYYTRILKRAQRIVNENKNVAKAIFVGSTNKGDWRGTRTLYENKSFDSVKSDTPEYTGCIEIGTIEI